jgi:ribonuclease HII
VAGAGADERLTLGIDEAGRGPILGPLVMAGVALKPRRSAALTRAGVADSKKFGAGREAHEKRKALAERIRNEADHYDVHVIEVVEIDRRVRQNQLNVLEREVATVIIERAPACRRIVLDGERMFAPLRERFPHAESHNNGESAHVAVAAASILAKVARDDHFFAIAERYEAEFGKIEGGGYENVHTRTFLERYVAVYGRLPPEARHSWGGATARLQLSLL